MTGSSIIGSAASIICYSTQPSATRAIASSERHTSSGYGAHTLNGVWILLGRVLAHTSKTLDEVTSADLLELRAAVRDTGHVMLEHFAATRLLFHLGIVRDPLLSPGYFRTVRPTVDQLVDSFGISNRAVRDVFVLYLKERESTLDFNSLRGIAHRLVCLFWCDINVSPECCGSQPARGRYRPMARACPPASQRTAPRQLRGHLLHSAGLLSRHPAMVDHKPGRMGATRLSMPGSRQRSCIELQQRPSATRVYACANSSHAAILARFVNHVRKHRDAAARLLAAAGACPAGGTFELDDVRYIRQRHSGGIERQRGAVAPVVICRADLPAGKS